MAGIYPSLHTGITNDLARRLSQHGGRRGAKYFRGRRPTQLVYLESGHTRSSASRREAQIKRLSRAAKLALLETATGTGPVVPLLRPGSGSGG